MAKESIPFTKYPALHQLENYHGVELGNTYSTADSAKIFTSYIAESQRKAFLNDLAKYKFSSFLIDESTDAGNLEDELIVVQCSMKDSNSEEVKSIVLVKLSYRFMVYYYVIKISVVAQCQAKIKLA